MIGLDYMRRQNLVNLIEHDFYQSRIVSMI